MTCHQVRTCGDFISDSGAPMGHCIYCASKTRSPEPLGAVTYDVCGAQLSRDETIRHATRLGIEDLAGSHDVLQLLQWIREDKKRMRSHTMGATRATLRHYGIKVDDDEIDAALRFVLEFYHQISKFNVSW